MKKVESLNLDGVIRNVKNRIARVGVELEGAWLKLPEGVTRLDPDGSVYRNNKPPGHHVGELPIGPVEPAGIGDLVRLNYPTKVNDTCGMHVHMSFPSLWYYQLLMVEEYQETIIEYLTRWAIKNNFKESHYIFKRLRGDCEYCQKGFWPDIQAGTKHKGRNRTSPGHRYTIVHYCGRQNTIEIRVLPMMQKTSLAVSAINEVIAITNACIYVLGSNCEEGKVSNSLPSGSIYEEYIEEIL
jgi:hypothetical protein